MCWNNNFKVYDFPHFILLKYIHFRKHILSAGQCFLGESAPKKVFAVLWRDAEFNRQKEDMKIKEVIKIKVYDGLTMEILAEERDDDIAILTLKLPLVFSSEVSLEFIE